MKPVLIGWKCGPVVSMSVSCFIPYVLCVQLCGVRSINFTAFLILDISFNYYFFSKGVIVITIVQAVMQLSCPVHCMVLNFLLRP